MGDGGEVMPNELCFALEGRFDGQLSIILLVTVQLGIQNIADYVFLFWRKVMNLSIEDDQMTGSADLGQIDHVSTLQQRISQSDPLVHGQLEQLPPLQS